jgi:Uma2 family endonuclease
MTPTIGPNPETYGRDASIARFTVNQYKRMIEEGILTPADRVELLENWLVQRDTTATLGTPIPLTYGRDPSLVTFTVDQYKRMIEADILTEDDPVELLENWVVLKMARNPPHDGTIQGLNSSLLPLLPSGWGLRIQSAFELTDSIPEPDLLLVKGNWRAFTTRHPVPADVSLVIEVADTSLARDRGDKTRIYARGGVVRYWIVNLVDNCIEVSEQPSGPTAVPSYANVTTYPRGATVPLILDGVPVAMIPVDDVLP